MARIKYEKNEIFGIECITDCPHNGEIYHRKVGSVACNMCKYHICTDGDEVECGYGEGDGKTPS